MHASQKPKYCGIVTRLHSFELYEWAPKINWRTVDKIILVSGAMQQKFCNLYPDQAYKTVVINNGISFDKFSPTLPTSFNLRIGMLCNIHPIKRVYEMVLNLYEIKKLGLKVCLDIAGNPDIDKRYTASIIRLAKELNLHDSVILEGYVADTTSWLQKIDIFISNSYWEGQQVALLEAMASGCYCLSHHWDGANELLPPNNLFYTSSELIEKILNYSNLSDNEKLMQKKTIHDIAYEKFDIRKTITQISQVIDEVSAINA
jgi:glycosyltransferase involved in cell wall biosynthesis